MTELIVVLLICVVWGITCIIIKLIERRCKHEWDNPDVTVLKTGNKLSFKCSCGCEFIVSQRQLPLLSEHAIFAAIDEAIHAHNLCRQNKPGAYPAKTR